MVFLSFLIQIFSELHKFRVEVSIYYFKNREDAEIYLHLYFTFIFYIVTAVLKLPCLPTSMSAMSAVSVMSANFRVCQGMSANFRVCCRLSSLTRMSEPLPYDCHGPSFY